MKRSDLATKLARIDELRDPSAMKRGATAAALAKLAKAVFGGKPVRDDVATLFKWHDGQSGFASIHPGDNRTLLSIAAAIEAWKFLGDPDEEILQPWSKTWLPLFANGAGDYLCIETADKKAGKLVQYWHADGDRGVAYTSLDAWADDVIGALATQKPPPPKTARVTLDWSAATWQKLAKPPTESQLDKRPIGTTLWWNHVPPHPRVALPHVFVKVEMATKLPWRAERGATLDAAFAKLQEFLDAAKPPQDSFWKMDTFTVAFDAKETCFDDGADDPVPIEIYEGRIAIK